MNRPRQKTQKATEAGALPKAESSVLEDIRLLQKIAAVLACEAPQEDQLCEVTTRTALAVAAALHTLDLACKHLSQYAHQTHVLAEHMKTNPDAVPIYSDRIRVALFAFSEICSGLIEHGFDRKMVAPLKETLRAGARGTYQP